MDDNDKVEVRAHHRRPRTSRGEETFMAEFPSIAPEKGAKIIDAHNAEAAPTQIERGVKRIGGGDHGKIEKGVKRLGYR